MDELLQTQKGIGKTLETNFVRGKTSEEQKNQGKCWTSCLDQKQPFYKKPDFEIGFFKNRLPKECRVRHTAERSTKGKT